jgi:hypothetical protein
MNIVLVTGGRDFKRYGAFRNVMDALHSTSKFDVVVHGDATGADTLANKWAIERGVKQIKFPANWTGETNGAGTNRNKFMLEMITPTIVVAFPGGRGTANMMRIAAERGIEVNDTEDTFNLTMVP